MLLLTTTDSIRVVTSAAADIEVYASYMDLNGTTVTPGRSMPASIVSAATTTVVSAPGAGPAAAMRPTVAADMANAMAIGISEGD